MEYIFGSYGRAPQKTLVMYDITDGRPSDPVWQDSIESPSHVCAGGGYLFTNTEKDGDAAVNIFGRAGRGWQLLDRRHVAGGYLCHICFSEKHSVLYGASYQTGHIVAIRVKDGRFGDILFNERLTDGDPETLSRAHCVVLNKDQTRLLVANIALDLVFSFDLPDGVPVQENRLAVPKGAGPRHLVYSSDEKLFYLITEYSNEILVYETAGQKRLLQTISTLPAGYDQETHCSTLCFSKDRQFLYGANRGADSVAVFKVGTDGRLTLSGQFGCGGQNPRDIGVSGDGRFMYVCNQDSGQAAIFRLDTHTGFALEQTAAIPQAAVASAVEMPPVTAS